jgi:general nucleoside transport system ATP-binding protein
MQIAIANLTKRFGSLAANDRVNLTFAGGQIHGVLGENGAGKSTLMKLLAGYLRPDSGEIMLDGQAQRLGNPAEALRAGVGMVHQEPLDVPAFTALENLLCAAPRWALPTRNEARASLTILAQKLGFSVAPEDPIRSLTVGQRQQLEIMRLLICGARALILDEPTTGITAAQTQALFAALQTLASEGNTILFVSHKLDEVAELCDTVSVLRTGNVVAAQRPMPVPQEQLLEMMFGQALGDERGQGDTGTDVLAPSPPHPRTGSPTWALEHLTLREGRLELRDLTLAIEPGMRVGLAGLDGSGQQVLLRALCGQLRPASGKLFLRGRDMRNAPAAQFRRAGVQYLPADRLAEGMIGALTLSEHFALQNGRGIFIDRQLALKEAHNAIAEYAIKARPESTIASLSGGNQQRTMLALLPEESVGILCDQPTRGLDVASAAAVWARLHERCAQGASLVFASADLDELLDHSDFVLVFFGGRVSPLIPRNTLNSGRLAELIGGVGL